MAKDNNLDNNKGKDIIFDSEKDRKVTHDADGATERDGVKVEEGRREDNDFRATETKKKGPWGWLIPLILLLILIPIIIGMCDKKDDNKAEENKTEETTTEEATTEEATTEASVKRFDLALITNFDLAS